MAKYNKAEKALKDYIKARGLDFSDTMKKEDKQDRPVYSLTAGLKQEKDMLVNFIVLIILWSTTSIAYYINTYQIKNLQSTQKSPIFYLIMALSIGEAIAYVSNRLFYSKLGHKLLFTIGQSMTILGAGGIIFMLQYEF